MGHDLICTWLGLPPDGWPPDHYRLLGLEPGETDRARIEQHVQQRLETVRRYQLTHPEPATEAMNRLAQAFVCLTDSQARKAYDASLFPGQAAPLEEPEPAVATVEDSRDPLAWMFGPWQQPAETPAPSTAAPTEIVWPGPSSGVAPAPASSNDPVGPPSTNGVLVAPAADAQTVTPESPPTVPSPAVPVEPQRLDAVVESAQASPTARRGLGTKQALYHRIARTRQLLRAWEQAGPFLAFPKRTLARRAEGVALANHLDSIRDLLREFPPLLGEAGQPGYLVLALARQPLIAQTFQALLPSQRDALARDWRNGHKLLTAHRDFIRQELRAMRRRSSWFWGVRAVRTFIQEHPGAVLLGLAALALLVALLRTYPPKEWRFFKKAAPTTVTPIDNTSPSPP